MPQKKNSALRILVPLVMLLAGVGVAIAVYRGNTAARTPQPAQPTPQTAAQPPAQPSAQPTTQPAPEPTPQPTSEPTAQPTPQPAAPQPATPAPAAQGPIPGPPVPESQAPPAHLGSLRAFDFGDDPKARDFTPIGELGPDTAFLARIEFSTLGAGIRSLRLAKSYETIEKLTHVEIQSERAVPRFTPQGGRLMDAEGKLITDNLVPMGAAWIEVESQAVPLVQSVRERLWREVAPGHFEAFIVSEAGERILRITREYRLVPGSFSITLAQHVENLTARALKIRWHQFGPVDLPESPQSYGGDKRKLRFGYLLPPRMDPSQSNVIGGDYILPRTSVLGKSDGKSGLHLPEKPVWPDDNATSNQYALSWAGMTNRHFGVAVHPIIDPGAAVADKRLPNVERIDRLLIDRGGGIDAMTLRFAGPLLDIAPNSRADLSTAFYAGPLSRAQLRDTPVTRSLSLDGLVVFNFGGMCSFCTFAFLTHMIFWLMHFLHDSVFYDWSLAIICLVFVVRTILHPVTRWSQIRLQRFGKQMSGMAPKAQKIQEKFKDDKAQLQKEMGKLWREEGISPTGLLGCVPLILVTPIWIALSATLYFAYELRHSGAFYGVFQAIAPNWGFMADLGEPDALYRFRGSVHVPLISGFMGPIGSINILPLILGLVFFVHQKYLTPPPTVKLTPEQEMQQKMVRWMSVIMFPVFMYNAPSGLALYFIANSTLAIFENKWIRAHIDKHGLLDLDKLKQKRASKPGKKGFLQRVIEAGEQRRKMLEDLQKQKQRPGRK